MSLFDVKKNPAICVLPWVHEYRSIDGKIGPCCWGGTLQVNDTIESIRQNMLAGKKHTACASCYLKEDESGYSPRINETINWVTKFGEPDIHNPRLEYIDVRFDPTCNLKCKMCGPAESTLWQKERKVSFPINDSNKDYLEKIEKKYLKKVYLAGGEPTYIKGYLLFLQELYEINSECEVIINSNLKRLSNEWKDVIKKFNNLTVVCSCDSIGLLGKYVRYPLGWEEFEENVKFVSNNANFLQFTLVASNLTSHKLFETCTWMKKFSKDINISILGRPGCFSERAVPLDHRAVYIDNIKKLKKFPVSVHNAMNFRTKIEYLLKKYSNSDYDKKLHEILKEEIADQDRHRTLKLQQVDAFLNSWIYE